MSRKRLFALMAAAVLGCGLFSPPSQAAVRVDFNRDILPILSDNCFHCHGPDAKARKGKFRLDTKEGAFRTKDGKTVIVPGKRNESELYRRITQTDPDEMMPPPESNRKLTPSQIEVLSVWIDQGAPWGQHWAFLPRKKTEPPEVKTAGWVRNGIDPFILARLEQENLQPSREADKARLIRRASLDITGLPPTMAESDAFAADATPEAFAKVIDRLLDSPRYGERMASDWLDLARYADTHGFQMDRYRPMWPWRDWVIQAFNRNQPYDQFATWQLAGDLLPNATKEQRLATAFNRHHLQNEEGGIVEEEYRVAYVVDRVNTMGTAFLGLTFECSRCHDHKFDPISQKEFYSLFSFFQNIDESGQTVYFTETMPVPTVLLSDDATDAKLQELDRRIHEKERTWPFVREQARPALAEWLKSRSGEFSPPGLTGRYEFEEIVSNKSTNLANSSQPAVAQEGPKLADGKSGKCVELNGDNGFTFPGVGHFTRTDPFSLALWLSTPEHAERQVVLHHSKAPVDAGSRGYELLLEDGHAAFGLHHMWPGNSLKVRSATVIPTNEWIHITFTYDGSSRAAGVHLYLNGVPAPLEVIRDGLVKDITYGGAEPDLAIGYRFRDSGFKGGRIDDLRIYRRELVPIEAGHPAGNSGPARAWKEDSSQLSAPEREGLLDYFTASVFPPALKYAEELHALRQEQNKIITPIPEAMAMKEMAAPKPSYVLKRGAYDARGELVTAGTPSVLPPFPPDNPRNRLGLARWLFDPAHPLTARVTANRIWQMMFGRGLVATSDNFGSQGSFPTHPELLDWLADQLVASGWDLKAMIKLIAMSATYRQSSVAGPELLARDPSNELLARGPARRLTAEMLRDQALAASGLLVEKIGGPSVKPYQPDGLWEEKAMGAPRYDQGHDADLHRRSLYTFWKRTVPHPAMMAFDAADRNVCTVRRQSTSTPLQALALLNDTQIVEASRRISERMLKEGGSTLDEKVAWVFRLVTGREASSREALVLKRIFLEQREIFAAAPGQAARLLIVGEAPSDPTLALADVSAGAILAQAILNHDEAALRR